MLRGRDVEQGRIDALLAAAREGASAALVLRGEPGIGKSALLEYAVARAERFRVLRASGVESEAEVPFAGLHQLLRPCLDRLAALPGPQRRALGGAFGLGEPSGDRFMVGAAVLSLLAEVADDVPLLCVADDAHWLDRASLDALLFAARRLDREGVVLLLGAREYERFALPGVPELRLAGLDEASAAELLADTGQVLSPAVRAQLLAATEGNPLALVELPKVLDGTGVRLGPIHLTQRVIDAFHSQVRALPAATRMLLLVGAADDTGDVAMVLRSAEAVGVSLADLHAAEAEGLVSVEDGRLTFRHPLLRAAIYRGATLTERIQVHQALAATFAAVSDADRNAWHLAIAATSPDERVAATLERAAARAAERGGHAAAASAFERAAQLSPDPALALERMTLGCEAGVAAGQLAWARSRAQRALVRATEPSIRARLLEVEARAEFADGAPTRAYQLLSTAAELTASTAALRAFWLLSTAAHAAWAAPTDPHLLGEPGDRADRLDVDAPTMSMAWLIRWATAVPLERDTATYPALETILPQARAAAAGAGPSAMVELAIFAFLAARDEVSAEVVAEIVATARANGTLFVLPVGLGQLALTQTLLGRHREALISGTEAVRIARDTGQPIWERYASAALAYLAAIEGNEEACRQHAASAELAPDSRVDATVGTTWAQPALALLDLGAGRVNEAFERLRDLAKSPTRHHSAVVRSVPDLVEAAVRLGRPDDAADAFAGYTRWAATLGQAWIDALVARCRALLDPKNAEHHYADALALHPRPFERARTALLYGEWLRRARRRREAREHLGAALQLFDELGAKPWGDRARSELETTGGPASRPQSPDVVATLTPQELHITTLAAQGLSNHDIAAQLFLSPRTVAYHLYKSYPKLGITSRAQLTPLFPQAAP